MLIIPPAVFRKRRGRAKRTAARALTLVAATYDEGAATLTLTFGRAVSVAGYEPAAVTVVDAVVADATYTGGAATLSAGGTVVTIALVNIGLSTGDGVRLSAGAANGIVAADDGAAWAGADELELPFP